MFLNLTPYITWLGIMLSSKPNDLQNRINILAQPGTTPPQTPTTVTTPVSTTPGFWDIFICTGRPIGRYAHPRDCTMYYVCAGDTQIVKPTVCPNKLYFSPTALLCTLPQDSGCTVASTTLTASGSSPVVSITFPPTQPPSSTWLKQLEAANYYKPVNEDRLVIYFDHDVLSPQNILWPISFTRNMWESIIMMYGNFGPENRLHIVFRGRPLSTDLNFSSYLDSNRGYINAVEIGSTDWSLENSTNTDLITRNLAELVSQNAKGIRYPAYESGWSDIFVYDLYQRVNRNEDRDRWEAYVKTEKENNIATIPMFSQWYLPIYTRHGTGSALNRFFVAREQNFPRLSTDNYTFSRTMNRGEFVHFWSGAAGANLTNLAATVFGWGDLLSELYQKAREDFKGLNY